MTRLETVTLRFSHFETDLTRAKFLAKLGHLVWVIGTNIDPDGDVLLTADYSKFIESMGYAERPGDWEASLGANLARIERHLNYKRHQARDEAEAEERQRTIAYKRAHPPAPASDRFAVYKLFDRLSGVITIAVCFNGFYDSLDVFSSVSDHTAIGLSKERLLELVGLEATRMKVRFEILREELPETVPTLILGWDEQLGWFKV